MPMFLNEWKKFLTEDSEDGTVEDRAYRYLIDNGVYKPIAPGEAMVDVFTGTTSAARTALVQRGLHCIQRLTKVCLMNLIEMRLMMSSPN